MTEPNIENLNQFENKYLNFTYPNGEGGAGWVVAISSYSEFPVMDNEGTENLWGRWIDFDYGMRLFVYQDTVIEELTPPEGDSNGPFKPEDAA